MAVGCGAQFNPNPVSLLKNLERAYEDAQITCEISLCSRKLKEFPRPPSRYDLSDTVTIDLSKNRLTEAPKDVCKYLLLERLHLNNNIIKSLPDDLGNLQQLTHLHVGHNHLSHLPLCICRLLCLEVLDVSGNKLTTLPEEISSLHKLAKLDASNNQITKLPASLGELDHLRSLRVRRNVIQNVPLEVCFLRLRVLDLSFNQICTLPAELRFMSSLVTLSVEANPLSYPPAQICMQGKAHAFKWLEKAGNKEGRSRNISEVEFRKLRKHVSVSTTSSEFSFDDPVNKRSTIDSGYNTSENGDYRRSQEANGGKPQESYYHHENQSLNGFSSEQYTSHSSTVSTPSTLSPGESFNLEDEFHKAMKIRQDSASFGMIPYAPETHQRMDLGGSDASDIPYFDSIDFSVRDCETSSSNDSQLNEPKSPYPPSTETHSPSIPIPTYREYLEAKKQQRALISTNIYKRNGADNGVPDSNGSGLHISEKLELKHRKDDAKEDVKTIQKEAVLSYVKARVSPTKKSQNSSFDSADHPLPRSSSRQELKAKCNPSPYAFPPGASQEMPPRSYHPESSPGIPKPVSKLRPSTLNYFNNRSGGSNSSLQSPKNSSPVSNGGKSSPSKSSYSTPQNTKFQSSYGFRPRQYEASDSQELDLPKKKTSYTQRREFDKQRHEKLLIDKLRKIIESRLKVSLPGDIAPNLMDGVVLCHLVNHVRPHAVSSIHVPSPAVPKLTVAKRRLNVENFLKACKTIGVEEEVLCSCDDIVVNFHAEHVFSTLNSLNLIASKKLAVIREGTQEYSPEHQPHHGILPECANPPVEQPHFLPILDNDESHSSLMNDCVPPVSDPWLSTLLLLIFVATLFTIYVFPPTY